nr:MAG TPA: hypothetical protein [Caudoviricetes sp.]
MLTLDDTSVGQLFSAKVKDVSQSVMCVFVSEVHAIIINLFA